jgi:hypothetical protein
MFSALILGLVLALVTGCDSCGDDDDSGGGATSDDDNDNDNSLPDDDDNDNSSPDDDDDNDDATPFCADGYLTPAGDCLTQIDGGDPGHNGISAAVSSDGTICVAAARSRELVLYSLARGTAEGDWVEEVVDRMAASPVIAFDSNNNLHLAFRDLWNRQLRYGLKTEGRWTFEGFDFDAAYVDLAVDYLGRPHLSYQDPDQKMIAYARREDSGWLLETPLDQAETGYITDIAVDSQAHAHIAFGAVGGLLGASYYATNETGYWRAELVELDTYCPHLDIGSNDVVHYVYSRLLGIEGQGILMHRYGSVGAWQTEEVDPTPFYNGLHDLNIRVDEALRPHVFYTGARLPIQIKLSHAVKGDDGWQTETVAAGPYDDIDYRYVTAYPAAADDYSVVRQTSPDGLQFYGPGPAYRPTTLGKGVVSDFDYFRDADGDERFFYKIDDRRLLYRRVSTVAPEMHEIETASRALSVRMAVDPAANTHLYYSESPESGTYFHRYEHTVNGTWTADTLPLDTSAYIYPVLAADANAVAHFFFRDGSVLTHLWKEEGDWTEEPLEENVAIPMAAAADAGSTLHIMFLNEDLAQLRHASKSPNGPWATESVASVDEGTITQVNLTVDPGTRTMAGCFATQSPDRVFYVVRGDGSWTTESLFEDYAASSVWGCGVSGADDRAAVVTTSYAEGLVLAVRADGHWTERVVDRSGGTAARSLYSDQAASLLFGYRAQSGMQRAAIPAHFHEEGSP